MIYWYKFRLRGLSIGCQPKDFVDHDHTIGRFGAVAYNRKLSDQEIDAYELDPMMGTGCTSNIDTPDEHARQMEKFWTEGDES